MEGADPEGGALLAHAGDCKSCGGCGAAETQAQTEKPQESEHCHWLEVTGTEPGSQAETAGIQPGDVISGTVQRIEKFGAFVLNGYGQAEIGEQGDLVQQAEKIKTVGEALGSAFGMVPGGGGVPHALPGLHHLPEEVVATLADRNLLPAIYFIFSRAQCDEAARVLVDSGLSFGEPRHQERIREIAAERLAGLHDDDPRVRRAAADALGQAAAVGATDDAPMPEVARQLAAALRDASTMVPTGPFPTAV